MNLLECEIEGSKVYNEKLATAKAVFQQQHQTTPDVADSTDLGISTADQMLYRVCNLVQQHVDTSEQLGIAIDPTALAAASDEESWMHAAPSDFAAEMQRIASKMSADLRISDDATASDRKSTRLNYSHICAYRMPSYA